MTDIKIVNSYQEACAYVKHRYWVKPIVFSPAAEDSEAGAFDRDYLTTDYAESGKVHYAKR